MTLLVADLTGWLKANHVKKFETALKVVMLE